VKRTMAPAQLAAGTTTTTAPTGPSPTIHRGDIVVKVGNETIKRITRRELDDSVTSGILQTA